MIFKGVEQIKKSVYYANMIDSWRYMVNTF